MSTCRLCRQCGQWLRTEPFCSGCTSRPQWAQVKALFVPVTVNRRFTQRPSNTRLYPRAVEPFRQARYSGDMNASGTFEVKMTAQDSTTNLGRFALDKVFYGDLEAVSQGEMLSIMTKTAGSAGYVALEVVTGRLAGRSGTFALQHSGIMNRGLPSLNLQIIPDSGTLELIGLAGTMEIDQSDGIHKYTLEYELPE